MLKSLLRLVVVALVIDPVVHRRRPIVAAIPIDNGVENEPYIMCLSDKIQVDFKTRNPFEGHVYVKGHYTEAGCRSDASAGARAASISIPFSKCGVQRTRSLNPRGVYVRAIVVITFHPQFLTKVDRAYAIQCFYMESEKTVSQQLEVSELTTAALNQQAPMPVCRYDVLEGGPDGQPVRFATIGEQVYHKWTCETQTVDTYCMIVRNCVVQNGAGNQAQLLDENGCAVDRYLLQNLEYTSDLMAGQEAHVFKFADQPALYFQCQITISVKEPYSNCPRPQCNNAPVGTNRPGVIYGSSPPYPPPSGGYERTTPPSFSGFVSAPQPAFLPSQYSRRAAAFFASGPGTLQGERPPNVTNNVTTLNFNGSVFSPFPFPNAGAAKRRRVRESGNDQSHSDSRAHELGIWDVDAQPITALEIDENSAYYQTQATRLKNGLSPTVISFQAAGTEERRQEICLNTITFGFIFSVAIAAALAAGTAMIIVCKKRAAKY